MANLIPSIGSCAARMSGGEKRFAQRLESKLDHQYLSRYDVPITAAKVHPNFVLLHAQRGLTTIEVRDWKVDALQAVNPDTITLMTEAGVATLAHPMAQARACVDAVVALLRADVQLVFATGSHRGKLTFPTTHGVVLANITRQQFVRAGLAETFPPQQVICQDEMTESVSSADFEKRLWHMFALRFQGALTAALQDRVRWHLFPELRLPSMQAAQRPPGSQSALQPAAQTAMPIMDLQQEQIARSLGQGHRVIHGVAGAGKTLILVFRAEQLARECQGQVLVLCLNKVLRRRLAQTMRAKRIDDKVEVRDFHGWCTRQLSQHDVAPPRDAGGRRRFYAAQVEAITRAVAAGQIPTAQYDAVLIDEAHDFQPEWLRLVTQMVSTDTDSLLVLYDDMQSTHSQRARREFSFKSVGIQAAGRTTVFKRNYRNTREILAFAAALAQEALDADDAGEAGIPRLDPVSAGRSGALPLVITKPTLPGQASAIAGQLKQAHGAGTPWGDMAVLYRHYDPECTAVTEALQKLHIPLTWQEKMQFDATQDTVKLVSFHACKGLEFSLVAIPAVPLNDVGSPEEQRLLYVAMTRATQTLIVTAFEAEPDEAGAEPAT